MHCRACPHGGAFFCVLLFFLRKDLIELDRQGNIGRGKNAERAEEDAFGRIGRLIKRNALQHGNHRAGGEHLDQGKKPDTVASRYRDYDTRQEYDCQKVGSSLSMCSAVTFMSFIPLRSIRVSGCQIHCSRF